jgi:hypothetical protein
LEVVDAAEAARQSLADVAAAAGCDASACAAQRQTGAATAVRHLVRVSSHTMAFISGRPVVLHHTTVVSRWLVMPRPSTETAPHVALAFSSAPSMHARARSMISMGSCSTHLHAPSVVSRVRPVPTHAARRNAPSLRHYLPVLQLVHRHRPQRRSLVHNCARGRRALVQRA